MAKKNYNKMASEILPLVGGIENVESFTNCMTRLRVTVKNVEKVDNESLKNLSFVIQLQYVAGVHQIVLGPGVVQKVAEEFGLLLNMQGGVIDESLDEEINENIGRRFIKMMQAVIMPAIGALMTIALINGILNVLKIMGVDITSNSYLQALSTFGSVGLASISVVFAMNLAKYLRGNIYLALLLGMFLVSPQITNVKFFNVPLVPGAGGLVGMLLMIATMCFIERKVKKVVPDSLSLIFTPLLTALLTVIGLLFIIIPISSVITGILVKFFTYIVNGNKVIFVLGSVALAASYPLLVLSGLHMSLMIVTIPVFLETGHTPLIAAAFLGGAAQLGTATAVYFKEGKEDKAISETYIGGAPTAILGVIEPLMYGINLPRVKPLILACVSAGIGGFFIGIFRLTMTQGLPGLIGVLSFTTGRDMLFYGMIWIGTAIVGYILCTIFYHKKEV